MIGDYTDIWPSEKKFNVDIAEQLLVSSEVSTPIKLGELKEKVPFQKVTITAKVLQVDKPSPIQNGKQVHSVQIADATGTAKLDLWATMAGPLLLSMISL